MFKEMVENHTKTAWKLLGQCWKMLLNCNLEVSLTIGGNPVISAKREKPFLSCWVFPGKKK